MTYFATLTPVPFLVLVTSDKVGIKCNLTYKQYTTYNGCTYVVRTHDNLPERQLLSLARTVVLLCAVSTTLTGP